MKPAKLAILLCMLSACVGGRNLSMTHPYALDTTPPPGSPVFQKAYVDGCESAMSGMGNQFIKVFHGFKYDASYAQDKLYNRMWEASNNYCRLFLFVYDEHVNNDYFGQYDKPFWFWQ